MLAIIYLCDYAPEGVEHAVLSSTLSSASLWREETHRLIRYLPKREQEALLNGEKTGDFKSLEFTSALEDDTHRFIFGPFKKGIDPDCLTRPKQKGDEAYEIAWGPCEFFLKRL